MKASKKILKIRKTYLSISVIVLLIALIIYSCKKIENKDYDVKLEIKTYHQSEDYKKLLLAYPEGSFIDLNIIDANDSLKAIITNVITTEGEIVKAVTYFQPKSDRNIWFPTIIFKVKGNDILSNLQNKNFTGSLEITTAENHRLNYVGFENNVVNYTEEKSYSLDGAMITLVTSGHKSKVMVSTGPKECLHAVDVCATKKMKDMGYIEWAACVATFPACVGVMFADCALHEKDCLGVNKPLASIE